MREIRKTIREFGPPIVRHWKEFLVFALAEVYASVSWAAKTVSPQFFGPLMDQFPWWVPVSIAVIAIIYAQFLVLHTLRKQRDVLRRVTDYELAVATLGELFNDGTAKMNYMPENEAEYGVWRLRWDDWRQTVENVIGEHFGSAERALFHNTVLFTDHDLPGLNEEHKRYASQFARKLEMLRAAIERFGERAAQQRHGAQR
jgi:hypothetical protein